MSLELIPKRKICLCCKEIKSLISFYKSKTNKDKTSNTCKLCSNKYTRKYYSKYKQELKEDAKWYMRKVRYNISKEKFDIKLMNQQYKCLICNQQFDLNNPKSIHIDHSHNDGQIRGILCHNCNKGLGNFKDNIEYLNSAIEYLKQNKD